MLESRAMKEAAHRSSKFCFLSFHKVWVFEVGEHAFRIGEFVLQRLEEIGQVELSKLPFEALSFQLETEVCRERWSNLWTLRQMSLSSRFF